MLYAEWSEFNFDTGSWIIPWTNRKTRHKVKHDHLVPLTDFHVNLLNQIKALAGNSKYLFPNTAGVDDEHRDGNGLTQAVRRFCKPSPKKDFERMTPFAAKTCRKTFKTLGAEYVKIEKTWRDHIQGHSVSDVSDVHYDKYDYEAEKRKAMQQWTDWLERTVNDTGANVVQLGSRNAN